MNDDEKLFRAKCNACHSIPRPNDYSSEQWENTLKKHMSRAKLNETQMNQLIRYHQNVQVY